MKKGAILVALILAGAVASGFAMHVTTSPTTYQVRYDYTVKGGETLWGIASRNCPDDMDVREYIHEVSKINGIKDGAIHPGQVIELYRTEAL